MTPIPQPVFITAMDLPKNKRSNTSIYNPPAGNKQEQGFDQGGKAFNLSVPVGVFGVRWFIRNAYGKQRHHCCPEIKRRVCCFR